MIQGFAPLPRRLNEDLHLLLDIRLPHVVSEGFRADRSIRHLVVTAASACDDAILFDAHQADP